MFSRTVKVASSVGLHARPAAIVAEAASDFDDDITLEAKGSTADAASLIEIMSLGAMCGDDVVVSSEDENAVNTIADLIEKNLDA